MIVVAMTTAATAMVTATTTELEGLGRSGLAGLPFFRDNEAGEFGKRNMTTRRKILALVLGGLMAALPASAKGVADEIARQMSRQGFRNISIEETWLGRTRITGTRNGGSREIIMNPKTGEILRDLWLNAQGQVRAADIVLGDDAKTEDATDDATDDARDDASDARDDARDDRQDARDDARDDRADSSDSDSDSSDSDSDSDSGSDGDSDND